MTARHTKRFPRAVQNTMKTMARTPHLGTILTAGSSVGAVKFTSEDVDKDKKEKFGKLAIWLPGTTWLEKFILI